MLTGATSSPMLCLRMWWCPLWCPNQDHLPSLKVTYGVKNLLLNVLLHYLGLRWIVKSDH